MGELAVCRGEVKLGNFGRDVRLGGCTRSVGSFSHGFVFIVCGCAFFSEGKLANANRSLLVSSKPFLGSSLLILASQDRRSWLFIV